MLDRLLAPSLLALVALGCNSPEAPAPVAPETTPPALAPLEPAPPPPPPPVVFDVTSVRVQKKKTLASTLFDAGVKGDELTEVLRALKEVYNFKKSRVGDQVRVTRQAGQLQSVEVRANTLDEWLVQRGPQGLTAQKRKVEIETRRVSVELAVRSTLYEAMEEAGEDSTLAVDIADVLAWDIDFYRDVRKGDRIRVVVDKVFARGRLLKYGDIHGVRYEGGAVGNRKLMRYTTVGGETSFYDEKGTSAKKPFLRSPLKFVRITSSYGGRKHPLAGYYQNHLGVDFAAEVGTPVWSVADGTVTTVRAGDPGAGNYVFVRHSNGYETGYLHLSSFAKGIAPGVRVQQKQVIAYSGNTGMSTGPHLHFAMKRAGHYMNPMAVKFPRSEPLSAKELPRFQEKTTEVRSLLDAEIVATLVPRPQADEPQPP